jgi:hypothetical protein
MGQMTQFRQILKNKESKSPDFYNKFQWVAKNIATSTTSQNQKFENEGFF